MSQEIHGNEAFEGMTEDQVLDELFETTKSLPERTVRIERLGLEVTMSGLLAKKVDSIRERCTIRKEKRHGKSTEQFDDEKFNAMLITASTTGLVLKKKAGDKVVEVKLSGWGDERLTSRMRLSGGEEVVRRILLGGELVALGDTVLDLSGYGVELDDVKNS
ncbi:hypothetical protein P4V33_09210 [Brevibacillus borstelensis]|uniref:phage tail assembly chaperone n=1 Tax=Brevibacillus borstelensis TaxID=45462 RepID=UPI002E1F758A|nr:hypothetical protein [Brevibacillus borstelensis]